MANSHDSENDFRAELLRQDEAVDSEYERYRRKLELALSKAEQTERLVSWLAAVSFAIAFALMFVGGSRVVGSFDPTEQGATAISVLLGVVYAAAAVLFWLCVAFYFLRFRPRVKLARDDIRDADILELRRQVSELRNEVAAVGREKSA